jgi:AhpD family alkylhydroperoxidase
MTARLSYAQFDQQANAARAALTALSKSAIDLGLDKVISELVKLRVSQINGCGFCVAFHRKMLRGLNVAQGKLDLIAVWPEAPDFSPAERAALAFAEDMTRLAMTPPSGASYDALSEHFSDSQIIGLNISIAGINAWNRLGVAFGFSPTDI